MALIDKYDQIVGSDFSSKVRIAVQSNNVNGQEIIYPPIFEGSSEFKVNGGIAVISNIIITAQPGNNVLITFSTDGIDLEKSSNIKTMEQIGKQNIDFQIDLQLRQCILGEQFTAVGKCLKCQDNSYSLIKMIEPGFCEKCPTSKAKCLGGAEIGPLPGFWRKSNTTKSIEKCFYQPACLGMIPPINNPMGECLFGYKGILCADCQTGYSRDMNFQCKQCPSYWINSVRLISILVGVIVLVVLMVRSTLNGAKDTSNH
ncbi:UNKNOWN [Stylonychia lemnae]|uniref:Transmembrane protein n=1 Tax=Stylonychia lemnae TaxID=5949 RepID=A0A077ZSP4_STYLE|nr:UNKNOWN [Stylonychia lemnae]|eukprot:CDW72330.1 UNKNOWN [Stylonychia lemnae]